MRPHLVSTAGRCVVIALVAMSSSCLEDGERATAGCSTALDCETGQYCIVGACTAPNSVNCTVAEECGTGFICLLDRCTPSFCFFERDCGSPRLTCDRGNRCAQKCVDISECPPGDRCTTRGTCVTEAQCDPPCGAREFCDPILEACVDAGCDRDDQCPMGQVCIGRVCTEGCREDAECGIGAVCIEGTCRMGCRDDGNCNAEEICVDGTCQVGCNDDDGCPLAEICESNECVPGCRDDDDCSLTAVCNDGMCVTDCREDGEEPNNDPNEATALDPSESTAATLCPDDPDWFSLSGGADCYLEVIVGHDGSSAPMVDVTIDDESIEVEREETADLVVVSAWLDGSDDVFVSLLQTQPETVTYTIDATVTCPGEFTCPLDDPHEENDTSGAAAEPPRTSFSGVICDEDDWFRLSAAGAGCTISATLDFDHDEADLALELHGPNEEGLVDESNTTSDREEISYLADGPGAHSLRIFANSGSEANWTLTADVDCEGLILCPNGDPNEPNESRGEATSTSVAVAVDGVLCGDDDRDFFQIATPGDCFVGATLSHDGPGDLSLAMTNSSGTVLDSSDEPGTQEVVGAPFLTGGSVFFEVAGDTDVPYMLTPSLSCADCIDGDANEPNDGFDEATPRPVPSTAFGNICGSDTDYFAFTLATSCSFVAELVSGDTDADLDMELRDGDQALIEESREQNSFETISRNLAAGDYYIRVRPFGVAGGDGATYTLELSCQ